MKAIFETLGYVVSAKGMPLRVYWVANPDGSPRWVIPAHAKRAYFLRFYAANSQKAACIALIFRLLFFFRLHHLLLKQQTFYLHPSTGAASVDLYRQPWALFTGTPGPNNKALLYLPCQHKFLKLGVSKRAQQLLKAEVVAAKTLTALEPLPFAYPAAEQLTHACLSLSDLGRECKRETQLTEAHFQALSALYGASLKTVEQLPEHLMQLAARQLQQVQQQPDSRLPAGMLRKLQWLYQYLADSNFLCTYSHGDFTPWNMFAAHDQLAIYDWELAGYRPLGFDAFHYIIQQGVLVERKSWKEIRKTIASQLTRERFVAWSGDVGACPQDYLRLYLLLNTLNYLEIYSRQAHWHTQVSWLLQVWNDGLSEALTPGRPQRQLLILDTFDFLKDQQYLALKFPDIAPEKLSEYSDIDLCLPKRTANQLTDWIKQHPLINHCQLIRKSHMRVLQLFLHDGSLLSLDLITAVRRKQLSLLSIQELLQKAEKNTYGIKVADPLSLARYLAMFYRLNHQQVPLRYQHFLQHLQQSEYSFDRFLARQPEASTLKKAVRQRPGNSWFRQGLHSLAYLTDLLREPFQRKGLVITFSGVDGAGKSTIIDHSRLELERRFRRKVVVLRHRPSLLPILSAWTKGKARAEQEAAETLPRQGTNSNILSSLFRFAYYYTDYFLGQFYVYLKHVCRGHILLYDRYYFDFINDARRSNIHLPRLLLRLGYRLLLKPDLNFFLYAKPEVILARKQELDAPTIELLTKEYLQLFTRLNGKRTQRYFAVENLELRNTLDFIVHQTTRKVA